MSNKLVASLLGALCTSLAAPAFASGYGPAPFYRPPVGAPMWQRAAERDDAADMQRGRGGMPAGSSQSGNHAPVNPHVDLPAHH